MGVAVIEKSPCHQIESTDPFGAKSVNFMATNTQKLQKRSVNTRLVSVPSQSCVSLPSTSKETVANSGDATPTSRFESKIQDLQVQMHV